MKNNNLKYLIAGTGGVGGSIAAFLALAGKDVTCIARGGHLAALRENGLKLHSDLKGEHTLDVPAYTAEEYAALASSADAYKADVIFVCVKGYSVDSITELIRHAAHKDTVVIPILNVYGTGPRIQRLVPGVTVLDGCIYIVGFVSGKGEITQMGKIFHTAGFAGKRHQGRHISRHQPRHLRQMVFHLGHGRYRSLLRRAYGRSAEARQSTRHLHRAFAGKRGLGTETGHRIRGRHRSVQPQGNRQACP